MSMKIKNYTSSVPANTSVMRIEQLLVKAGAQDINKKYEGQELKAISFLMMVGGNVIPFKLPAKIKSVEKVLMSQIKRPQPGTRDRIKAQSERTAWKLVHEWVQIQMTMIQLIVKQWLRNCHIGFFLPLMMLLVW